jgi:hypothetical protein
MKDTEKQKATVPQKVHEKVLFSFFAIVMILLSALLGVVAGASAQFLIFGHSADKVEITMPEGGLMSLQQAIDRNLFSAPANFGCGDPNTCIAGYSEDGKTPICTAILSFDKEGKEVAARTYESSPPEDFVFNISEEGFISPNYPSFDLPTYGNFNVVVLPTELCGSSHDGFVSIAPTTGLCAENSTSSGVLISDSGWQWTCTLGTQSATCSASYMTYVQVPSNHNETLTSALLAGENVGDYICNESSVSSDFAELISASPALCKPTSNYNASVEYGFVVVQNVELSEVLFLCISYEELTDDSFKTEYTSMEASTLLSDGKLAKEITCIAKP